MTLLDALKAVGSEDMSGRFPEHFLNEDFIPRPDDLELTEKAVGENARFCSLKEETVGKILEAVRAASADPAVSLLAKTVFRCIFTEPGAYAGPWAWQPLDKAMGPLAGPLYLAIAAGWVPLLRAYHGAVNVPEEVTRDTCYQLRAYCDNYFTGTGKCGIYPQQLSWMHCYLDRDRLFVRLGRFEYRECSSTAPDSQSKTRRIRRSALSRRSIPRMLRPARSRAAAWMRSAALRRSRTPSEKPITI